MYHSGRYQNCGTIVACDGYSYKHHLILQMLKVLKIFKVFLYLHLLFIKGLIIFFLRLFEKSWMSIMENVSTLFFGSCLLHVALSMTSAVTLKKYPLCGWEVICFNSSSAPDMYKKETVNIYPTFALALTASKSFRAELLAVCDKPDQDEWSKQYMLSSKLSVVKSQKLKGMTDK